MAHDVFISHSTRDKPVADAVCATLENAGIRCWVAPRDVQLGRSFAGEITRAIQQSKAMVLVFSENSNNSSQVLREVQLAVEAQLHILQFRIEDVRLNDDLKYFLSTPHWLDAMTPPLENHLGRLAHSITTLLGKSEPAAVPPAVVLPHAQARPVSSHAAEGKSRQRRFPIWGLAAAVAIIGIGVGFIVQRQREMPTPSPTLATSQTSSPTPPGDVRKINFSGFPPGFLEPNAFLSEGIRSLKTFGGKPSINDIDPGMIVPRGYTRVLNVRGEYPLTTLAFEFEPAIKSFSLTRIGGNPTSLPSWRLEASDPSGTPLDTVIQDRGDHTEPRIRTPATFTVRGNAISTVTLTVDNRFGTGTWATYSTLPIVEIEFRR
jgi:TIR domain